MSQINNTNEENINTESEVPVINTNEEENSTEESQESTNESEELSEEEQGEVDNFKKGLRSRTYEQASNIEGTYSYILNNSLDAVQGLTEGEKLEESFSYTVYDKEGASSTSEVIVSIKGTNDSPTIEPLEVSVKEDDLTYISGSLNPILDPDNELDGIISENTYYLPIENTNGMYGNFTLSEEGTYSYTLNNNSDIVQNLNNGEYLTETFSYVVYDENGGQATSTITIKIEGKNEGSCGGDGDNGSAEHVQLHVVEDEINSASGKLSSLDLGEKYTASTITNEYGTLTINEDGTIYFVLDNNSPFVDGLNDGDKVISNFTFYNGEKTGTISVIIEGTSDSPSGYSEDYKDLIGDYNLGGILSSSHENLEDFFDIAENNSNKKTDYSHVIDYSASDTSLNTEATIQSEIMKMG